MALDLLQKEGSKVELSSSRLVLRGAIGEDAEYLNGAFSDTEVMRYWSELPHNDMARTQQWINMMIDSSANGVTDFIICLKPNLVPIGKIGIWQGEEIGFLLAQQYWGQGLAREALGLILNHLFEKKGLTLITADTDPRNAASIGLLKTVGFEEYEFKEKTFQIGDEWVDSLYLKLTKEAWSARKPK